MTAAEDRLGLATRDEAVAACRVSERTFDRRVLPHLVRVQIGRRILFRWEDIERWLEDQQVGPLDATSGPGTTRSGFGTVANDTTSPRARRFAEKLSKQLKGSTTKSRRDADRE